MANFKKMDEHDFVFVNKPLTPAEEKEFSDFLKARRSKVKTKRVLPSVIRRRNETA